MAKSFDRDSPTLNSHRHSHQWQPWKSSDLRHHQHRPHCAVSLPSALSLVASALASNSVSVISFSLSPHRLLLIFHFYLTEKSNISRRISMCSCRLFELYGNETKMKLLAKELASLQNIGSQNCITFSVDGSKFATGGSSSFSIVAEGLYTAKFIGVEGKRDDALDLLNANDEVVKDRMNAGSKGIQEAAILDVLALGYVAVGHLKTVASLLNVCLVLTPSCEGRES
ncbi:hypothetical protein Ahy_B10g103204 [Arachis hypogaea]|uniref:Uncharacterized protein n=1 Tax=Arachis hypogaea TaxID=3818 RepID=A0A444X380_ARAHY|nr:hypothetical protein Ahy_B10g103204 [Arachis hypogaea]